MKQFACGAIVPGCTAVFQADSNELILAQVAGHAQSEHSIGSVSDELAALVLKHTQDV